ncbi:MAG: type I-E CRISPR-associated protein Cse2/CasB [Desulfovibrionaceae bacterium]
MSGFKEFQKNDAFWKVVGDWRRSLSDDHGQRAELRRARSGDEVFLAPAYHRGLVARLDAAGFPLSHNEQRALARGAGLLAHLKRDTPGEPLARRLAEAPTGSQQVRDVRFRRLLATDDPGDLYLMLLRLLRYLDGAADARDLVAGAFYWSEITKRQWAERYFTGTKKGD